MPSIFKALSSITVWVLFIFGSVSMLGGFYHIFLGNPTVDLITAYFGLGVGSLFLSVASMKLRHIME